LISSLLAASLVKDELSIERKKIGSLPEGLILHLPERVTADDIKLLVKN
jgi:hypothetical protein